MTIVFYRYSINLKRSMAGFVCLAILAVASFSQEAENPLQVGNFPVVNKLQRGDAIFDQLASDLQGYYKARSRQLPPPSLTLTRYTVTKGETLFTISARLNLPHSTIASLNHLSNPGKLQAGMEIIIPNLPGIYLSSTPRSGLEHLLLRRLQPKIDLSTSIRFTTNKGEEDFNFFPSEDFSPQERRAFLGSLFIPPLQAFRVSSGFGPRRNPFSGQLVHHDGLDLVAPIGSAVISSSDGVVMETGYDPVYGNFIIIDHGGGYESIYGHLQKILVRKTQSVISGDKIGQVGMSGQTTGPHLHFEIHYNGQAKDPSSLMRRP